MSIWLNMVIFLILEITCEELPDDPNGRIIYTPDESGDHCIETIATYDCEEGFKVTGDVYQRTCKLNDDNKTASWSEEAITCQSRVYSVYYVPRWTHILLT